MSPQNIWLWKPAGPMSKRSQRVYETEDPLLQGTWYKLIHSNSQHRGNSLKRAWVIHEEDGLTNFRACAQRVEIYWNFLCTQRYNGHDFFLFLAHPLPTWSRVGRCYFWLFPLNLLAMLAPPQVHPWNNPAGNTQKQHSLCHQTLWGPLASIVILKKWFPLLQTK